MTYNYVFTTYFECVLHPSVEKRTQTCYHIIETGMNFLVVLQVEKWLTYFVYQQKESLPDTLF